MAEHNDFGTLAEELATNFLVENGYKILQKNFRYQRAEIDIIAEFQNQIIVVEVKARGTDIFMAPEEAVSKTKIKLLVLAADQYLKQHNIRQEVRFDIITVLPDNSGKLEIKHLEDSFQSFDAN
jgi:putative endonuclease